MRIEEGKYYRTRDGRKVGPMVYEGGGEWEFEAHVDGSRTADGTWCAWRADGSFDPYDGKEPHRLDLVAEWVDSSSPIVTETVRRIKPGVYGPLEITREAVMPLRCGDDAPEEPVVYAALIPSYLCASDWRELARVALEIAEYLDAQ